MVPFSCMFVFHAYALLSFPRRWESTPLRHSRANGNPSHSVIPMQTGIHISFFLCVLCVSVVERRTRRPRREHEARGEGTECEREGREGLEGKKETCAVSQWDGRLAVGRASRPSTVIPTKVGTHITRHSHESGNPYHSVIPVQTGIHISFFFLCVLGVSVVKRRTRRPRREHEAHGERHRM